MRPIGTTLAITALLSCPVMLSAGHPLPASPVTQEPSVATPPSPRDARALGVGRYVGDATGRDLDGVTQSWRAGRGSHLTVIALTSVTCPLCRKFAPSLSRIEADYVGRGVNFVYVNVSGTDTREETRAQAQANGFMGLYLQDEHEQIVSAVGALTTTEVFVVDAANTLVYRGAVSDQYGVNFTLEAPRTRYLEQALDAALRSELPAIRATNAPGCAIEVDAGSHPHAPSPVTYARDIARILQDNCVECHRSGGVAPFALDTFEAVERRARMIRTVTQDGLMPPWFAGQSHDQSPWANDRALSQAEKETIVAWVEAGKPRGDDAEMPLPRAFPTGEWSIGTPDAVFQIPERIAIKADGFMPYQNVLVPTNLAEDKWVRGAQIVPTDKSVVHHVLVFVLPEDALRDRAARRRAAIEESRGFFAAYVPGNDAVVYPQGMAKRLPKGSVLAFQIHYTPSGTATQDQLKIGFVFGDAAPRHIVRTAAVSNRRIRIPAGAADHAETASVRLPADARLLAFMPHLHVRGKAFRYEIERPGAGKADGKEMLLDIPRYDFNWQLRYFLREPVEAPRGSRLVATAWYDNSADNPANPDPGKTVRWGPQTYDEMMLGYVEYYLVEEDPSQPDELAGDAPPANRRIPAFDRLLQQFDENEDGRIERSEVPIGLRRQFDRLDRSKDGVLSRDDFSN